MKTSNAKNTTRFYLNRINDRGCDYWYLAAVAIPAYSTYTQKAKFSEVVIAAEARKASVETCFREAGNSSVLTDCDDASNGVPAAQTTANGSGKTNSISVTDGVITAAAIADLRFCSCRFDANGCR